MIEREILTDGHGTCRYHSFYSPTGIFMVRHGDYKLIQFGKDKVFGSTFPDQLFNLKDDPHVRAKPTRLLSPKII